MKAVKGKIKLIGVGERGQACVDYWGVCRLVFGAGHYFMMCCICLHTMNTPRGRAMD